MPYAVATTTVSVYTTAIKVRFDIFGLLVVYEMLQFAFIALPAVPSEESGRAAKVSSLPGGSSDLGISSVVTPHFPQESLSSSRSLASLATN